ncbi:probable pectinesterase/pectinesterase inhibitor 13 [Oryza glaberrima]|uniref:pectinesterase n=1 Tax=Oryza glaberrima TaxID=4538 RepID=I1PQ68_ORYGL|nr:probable pectinesterase/pectinesterase inhibitor 13 [Oryza glaberrima]
MPNNAAIGSIIAAVGVVAVVCAIAAVTSSKKDRNGELTANVRLSTVCSVTRYPGRCEQSLGPVVNDTIDPESVLRAALQVALEEVTSAFNHSMDVGKDDDAKITKSAIEMCKKLLDDAIEDLRGMASLKPEEVTKHVNDLRCWLSSVMTYIYTCADGFDKPELKEAMDKLLQNSTELSSNALAIITSLGELMPAAKSNGSTGAHRRLLGLQGSEAAEGVSLRELLAVHDKVQELTDVKDVSRHLLSETLDAITEMSHDAGRRLLGVTLSEATDDSDDSGLPGRRLLSMSFHDADHGVHGGDHRRLSMSFHDADHEVHGGEHRRLSMSLNDADPEEQGGEHRRLSMSLNDADPEVQGGEHRRLSISLNDADPEVHGDEHRRLSMSLNDADTEVHGGEHRQLSMSLNDADTEVHGDEHRRLSMSLNEAGTEQPSGEHRQLSVSSSDAGSSTDSTSDSDTPGGDPKEPAAVDDSKNAVPGEPAAAAAAEHRQLGTLFNAIHNMTSKADTVKRRLLSMPQDGSDATEHGGGGRALLSIQLQSIADMSAEMNRHLLAAELPDELAGKRQLLSTTLRELNEATTAAKGQLDKIENGTVHSDAIPERILRDEYRATPHHRLLTTDVVGTIEDIEHERHNQPKPGEFPSWVSAHQRRLLQAGTQKPDKVVAKDGSGDFKTITEAVNAVPKNSPTRFVIYVKAGEYNEYVTIPSSLPNIFMYGDGPTKTRVLGNKSNKDGVATMATRTFSAEGNGFVCKSMGFVNTAGPEGHQAVALHVQGDMSVFFNCKFEGYQDTLYVHANRQFFRNCEVTGTIDYIFGNSAAVFQSCLMTVRKPMDNQANMVTAHGRTDPNMPTGIVLQDCRIVPEQALFPVRLQIASYLGRPWKEYARTVVMESVIGDFIKPEGWSEWMGDVGLKTLYYAEYANTGPGAGTSKRVTWPGYRVIGQAEATQFTAGVFIDGLTWLKNTATPNVMGFVK